MRKVEQSGETAGPVTERKTFVLKITRIHSYRGFLPQTKIPANIPFSLKNIPYRYSSYEMKNMNKGITSSKVNKGPRAYKTKKI